jgi:hypothetical protein
MPLIGAAQHLSRSSLNIRGPSNAEHTRSRKAATRFHRERKRQQLNDRSLEETDDGDTERKAESKRQVSRKVMK